MSAGRRPYGTTVDIRIPRDAIATVRAGRRSVPGNVHVERGADGVVVDVGVLKQTRVAVALHRPILVQLPGGPEETVELRLYVDDAAAIVAAARDTNRRRRRARPRRDDRRESALQRLRVHIGGAFRARRDGLLP